MPDQEASTVAVFWSKKSCHFRVPLLIHSDRGRYLILFCKVYQSLGMKKTETKQQKGDTRQLQQSIRQSLRVERHRQEETAMEVKARLPQYLGTKSR